MFKTKYIGKIQETPTDWSFRFEIPEGFEYKGGQYSVIRIALAHPDSRSNARTCSTSSSPTEPYLQFTFTIRNTGYKDTLMEMEPGTEVELTPARGKMILDEVKTNHCVMIAGGIGVTPFRGIIKEAYDLQRLDKKITLIYSDKTLQELAFFPEFKEIESKYKNFNAFYTLTRHTPDAGEWNGRMGRINEEFIVESIADLEVCTFMICGPVDMCKSAMSQLAAIGVPRERVITEMFTGY